MLFWSFLVFFFFQKNVTSTRGFEVWRGKEYLLALYTFSIFENTYTLGDKHWCINNIHPLKVRGILFHTRSSSNVTVFSVAQVITKSVRKPCGKLVSSLHTETPLEGYFPWLSCDQLLMIWRLNVAMKDICMLTQQKKILYFQVMAQNVIGIMSICQSIVLFSGTALERITWKLAKNLGCWQHTSSPEVKGFWRAAPHPTSTSPGKRL